MNYRYFLNLSENIPLDVENYSGAEGALLYSEKELADVDNIHTWETDTFEGRIIKTAAVDGGPWVYRVEKK